MLTVNHLVLDVLKPHAPNILELGKSIAAAAGKATVKIKVLEMDERTETVVVEIEGKDLRLDHIEEVITSTGASLHSIDEVEVTATRGPS